MVILHTTHAPELQNFNHFMAALRRRFKDSLADWMARERIKTVRQGHCPVAEYMEEFRDLASRLNWLENVLVSHFKDGLNDDLYHASISLEEI